MSEHTEMKPRLLLVEDDPVSRSFMVAALQALPAEVELAESMASALACEGRHDLWLLDVNLPDGRGIDLLRLLRSRFPGTPAVAHTADDSPALRVALLAAGFDEVLVKPLGASHLRDAVSRRLSLVPSAVTRVAETGTVFGGLPLWDQATALAALNGNQEHVITLRDLFLGELDRQHRDIVSALQAGQPETATKTLHQLKASSGFVGALRLHAAAQALEKSLGDASVLRHFSTCVVETRSCTGQS